MFKYLILFVLFYLIIVLKAVSMTPGIDICGDGVDTEPSGYTKGACPTGWMDSVYGLGCDLKCTSPDQDGDRYTTDGTNLGYDCDDTNRNIYPGITIPCGTAGWKTCQANGQYTACSESELCEKKGSGNCYYIDSVNGLNSNDGLSRATAWQHPSKFAYHYNAGTRPANYHTMVAGDVYYFMTGTYNNSYQALSGWDNTISFRFNSMAGTPSAPIVLKAYPGQSPVLKNPAGKAGLAIKFEYGTNNFIVEGFEITNDSSGLGGITIDSSNNIEIRNNKIHNIRGIDNNNLSAISSTGYVVSGDDTQLCRDGQSQYCGVGDPRYSHNNINLHHNIISDVWDTSNPSDPDRRNTTCIVFFRGNQNKINDNVCFWSPQFRSSFLSEAPVGIKYKHADDITSADILHNVISYAGSAGIQIGSPNTNIKFNRIYNIVNPVNNYAPTGVHINDLGGATWTNNITVSNNTLYNVTKGVSFGITYANTSWNFNPGNIVIENNLIVYNKQSELPGDDAGLIDGFRYDTNEQCTAAMNMVDLNDNCYYNIINPSVSYWKMCGSSTSGGGTTNYIASTLAQWKGFPMGWDSRSYYENPLFNTQQIATSENCQRKGWRPTPVERLPRAFGGRTRIRAGRFR